MVGHHRMAVQSVDLMLVDPEVLTESGVPAELRLRRQCIDLGDGQALISTTDFFMPIVDDPFYFGRIAAANAISDVYAMGGKPMMAIAILGWPIDKLPAELAPLPRFQRGHLGAFDCRAGIRDAASARLERRAQRPRMAAEVHHGAAHRSNVDAPERFRRRVKRRHDCRPDHRASCSENSRSRSASSRPGSSHNL